MAFSARFSQCRDVTDVRSAGWRGRGEVWQRFPETDHVECSKTAPVWTQPFVHHAVYNKRTKNTFTQDAKRSVVNRDTTALKCTHTTIIIMETRKAPTLRLKALNKHSMTRRMYIEMENVISSLTKKLTHNVDINKGSSITM